MNDSGKRSIVFKVEQGFSDQEVEIPCGKCIGCRLERSRQWAIRCMHEAACYDENCFITLTYSPENLPEGESLVKADFQKFMKRLRKHANRSKTNGVRFFMCGEYGEKGNRPHYHACLFNFDFDDKEPYKTVNGNRLYTSATLSKLWTFGFHTIGAVTFDSAAYVARYVMKKSYGTQLDVKDSDGLTPYESLALNDYYGFLILDQVPEYTCMSRRDGIGVPFYEKFKGDIYPSDNVIINGLPMNPPKFYDGLLELDDPNLYARIKGRRKKSMEQNSGDRTLRRLRDRERCKEQKLTLLPRRLETDD